LFNLTEYSMDKSEHNINQQIKYRLCLTYTVIFKSLLQTVSSLLVFRWWYDFIVLTNIGKISAIVMLLINCKLMLPVCVNFSGRSELIDPVKE